MTPEADLFKARVSKWVAQISNALNMLKVGLEQEITRCREDSNVADLARAYANFREEWEKIAAIKDSAMAEVAHTYRRLGEVDFPEALEMSGLANVPLDDVGRTISVQVRTKASVVGGAKEEAVAFLRADATAIDGLVRDDLHQAYDALVLGGRGLMAEAVKDTHHISSKLRDELIEEIQQTTEGLEAIVVDHIFPQTLSSLAKGMAEEGKELPEEIFTTFLQPTTTWRKLAPKK